MTEQKVEEYIISYMKEKREKLTPREEALVSQCLRAKRNKGIKIDDQAIAICISEARKGVTGSANTGTLPIVPVKRERYDR